MKTPSSYRLATYSIMVGGATLAASSVFFLWKIVPSLWTFTGNAFGQNEGCGCLHYLSIADHPLFWGSVFALAGASILFLGGIMFVLVRDVVRTRRFLSTLHIESVQPWRETTIVTFISTSPLCFTSGFFRPVIYISSAVPTLLSDDELTSVLKHERAHVRRRDPVLRWLVRGFFAPLSWIPRMRHLEHIVETYHEQRADASVDQSGARDHLVSALLKMAAPRQVPEPSSLFGSQEARLRFLLGERLTLPHHSVLGMFIAIVVLAVGSGVALAQGPVLLDQFYLPRDASEMTASSCMQQITHAPARSEELQTSVLLYSDAIPYTATCNIHPLKNKGVQPMSSAY